MQPFKSIAQETAQYLMPLPLNGRMVRMPLSLIWKMLLVFLAEGLVVGAMFIPLAAALPDTDSFLGVLTLLTPFMVLADLVAGALGIKWYYRGIQKDWVFKVDGKAQSFMTLKAGFRIYWACVWRIWVVKLLGMLVFGAVLVLADALLHVGLADWVLGDKYFGYLMRYDTVLNLLAVMMFLPFVQNMIPAYTLVKKESV